MADSDTTDNSTLKEHWFVTAWRPAIAWLFFAIIGIDFIIAPAVNLAAVHYWKIPYTPWSPMTLQGGGLFFICMGTIIGVNMYTKGLADIESVRNQPDYSNVPAINSQYSMNFNNSSVNDFVSLPDDPIPGKYVRGHGRG